MKIIAVVGHFVKVAQVEHVLIDGQIIQSGLLYMLISVLPLIIGVLLLSKEGKNKIQPV